ncbi:hypothetical protein Tco_1412112 [Tanacetum coccineum]
MILMVILLIHVLRSSTDFRKKKCGQNSKGKDISNNNVVGSSSSSGFTDEQIAALISLIKDNKVGKNVQANMIANQHMTNTDIELDNVYDISHLKIKVGHPNGTEAFISKIGNLKLPNGLVLYDVLVIPEYCVTLIFVHKLAKDNKIFVAFDESRCYFLNQDLNLKKVLGIGNQLGHPADPVLNVLENDLQIENKSQTDGDDIFAAHDEHVTTFEDNISYGGNLDQNPSVSTQGNQNLRRSSRQSVFPRNYNDFVVDSKVKYVLEKYVGYSKLNSKNYCFVTQINKNCEPKTFFEASKFSHWTGAMNSEMDALLKNNTWDIIDILKDRKAIGSKWIFKIKYKSSGEIDR